jgi:hypothetical protein
MAFTLALTFWIAAAHFDSTRQTLHREANAIRDSYRRAGLLSEPYRTGIRNLLREYVDLRLKVIYRTMDVEDGILRSEDIHNRLWSQMAAAREQTARPVFDDHFIQSLDEVIDQHMWRVAAYKDFRIPSAVWGAIYVILALAMFSIGFHAGKIGMRRTPIVPAFILIFSVVIFLIAELDNPNIGTLRVSQRTMFELRNMMGGPND